MIDGIKILCINTTAKDWLNCKELDFTNKVNLDTGEIKSNTKVAFYNGLVFKIVPSTTTNKYHCILSGSLTKYYNNGLNNAFDFYYWQLLEVVKELETKFNICPSSSIVQSFEYGLNIIPTTSTSSIIRGLRAYGNQKATYYKENRTQIGKEISRQQYKVKVYDKKKQSKANINTDLLRLEYAVLSQKKARTHNIETLKDLTNLKKLKALEPYLLDIWQNAIFFDKGIKWRLMTCKQQKKWLYYLDATNWERFNKSQRYKAKTHFESLKNEFSTSTTQKDIYNMIRQKLDLLAAHKGDLLRNFQHLKNGKTCSQKKRPFTHLDKGVKRNLFEVQKTPEILETENKKNTSKKAIKKCLICSKEIEHKKSGSKYCSKTCNNKKSNQVRTLNRQNKRKLEQSKLNNLKANLKKSSYWLNISYKIDGLIYTDHLHQSEIKNPPKWFVWRVFKVEILEDTTTKTILTTLRAKKLINYLTSINLKQ